MTSPTPGILKNTQPIAVPGGAAGVDVGWLMPDGQPRVLYVAQEGAGLAVVDLVDPGRPIIASYDTPGSALGVTIVGATAYVADHVAGLNIVRLLRDRQEATITAQGGSLATDDGSMTAIFPAGAFSETVTLTYKRLAADWDTGQFRGIGQTFELTAASTGRGQPADLAPDGWYAVVLRYTDAEKGPAIEQTLRLYFRDGDRWVTEPTSQGYPPANALTALPMRLGWWTVMGETLRHYLPMLSARR